ncbi:hypothetical protein METH_22685 (plasmid) [Leisingera methylohalidivorans DSM 14336]|uniref:Phenazine biosynthesis PhzC/PhzF protein n=2 Tax=Leisingera methylohalidivorans TaxID=133924 RepID=V9W0V6_9RHOB|nr:hypothetical protein METH_22685 [Leisingera methylohalidivorans DSM 14336]
MCGHVTVAIFAAMFEDERITEGRYEQHTRAGIIPVEVDSGGKIWMSQPLPRFDLNAVSVAEAAPLLGLESKAIIDVASASSALRHVFVEVPDEQTLARLRPDDEGLRGLSASRGIDTIGVWCWQSGGQGRLRVRLRDLCHGVGDPEEAASGTTNGALACHIHRAGRIDAATNGEVRMIGEQGFEMGRASRVETILTEHSGNIASVRVGGHAEARLKGQYFLK